MLEIKQSTKLTATVEDRRETDHIFIYGVGKKILINNVIFDRLEESEGYEPYKYLKKDHSRQKK